MTDPNEAGASNDLQAENAAHPSPADVSATESSRHDPYADASADDYSDHEDDPDYGGQPSQAQPKAAEPEAATFFADLGLSPLLLEAVTQAGYTQPTPIQAQAIPRILGGEDVLGIAQTGTGKTASFVLPMIDRLAQGRTKARMPRTLILEPTRELAAQVADNFVKYGTNHKLTMALLIGGVSFADQDALLTRGVDVLIATPGRLMDHFERGRLLLTGVEMLVIDEADRMLDMGFIPDIERICKLLPASRQTLLFSATMPGEIARLAEQFQRNPVRIAVSRPAQTAETISQYMVTCPRSDAAVRRAILRSIIRSRPVKNGIVFCNRKTEVDLVAKSLRTHGFNAAAIHGDLAQSYRTETLAKFRAGDLQLLVASDVAARGLDIPDVGHVFNFAPPRTPDDYVHRIGRTGRAGRTGESFTIVAPDDRKNWEQVLKKIGKPVQDYTCEGLSEAIGEVESRPVREHASSRSGRGGERSLGRTRTGGDAEGAERSRPEPRKAEPRKVEASAAETFTRTPRPAAEDSALFPEPRSQPREPRRARDRDYPREASRGQNRDRSDNVVGFGDSLPAFLAKPPRRSSPDNEA
jgi:superfamily II DNA/RNA helicase